MKLFDSKRLAKALKKAIGPAAVVTRKSDSGWELVAEFRTPQDVREAHEALLEAIND